MSESLVILCAAVPACVMIILTIILLLKLSQSQQRDLEKTQRELRYEMDRSRQETVSAVNSSIQNFSQAIAQNQKDSAIIQGRRLAEMNRQITDSLEQVNRGLGQMQNLARDVGDLQKLLNNVKTRGMIGEVQLGAILEQILAPEQYDENVAVTGTRERVEFAVKFPGEGSDMVYLPIDSKFPLDAYSKLQDAYERGDRKQIRAAYDNMKNAVLKAAKDISTKYIMPPYTTEFAIMFLPFEGLYAEVLRMDLVERLQSEYKVTVAGPATMAAMLNSFQMGFRSLALQRQSGKVWDTLSKARTEFGKFADVLGKTQERLDQAQAELEKLVGQRTRSIQRALENVDSLREGSADEEQQ